MTLLSRILGDIEAIFISHNRRFEFKSGKTQLVSFENFGKLNAADVNMDGSVHDENLSFKILGLSFSSKLQWVSYIVSIAKTISNYLCFKP